MSVAAWRARARGIGTALELLAVSAVVLPSTARGGDPPRELVRHSASPVRAHSFGGKPHSSHVGYDRGYAIGGQPPSDGSGSVPGFGGAANGDIPGTGVGFTGP